MKRKNVVFEARSEEKENSEKNRGIYGVKQYGNKAFQIPPPSYLLTSSPMFASVFPSAQPSIPLPGSLTTPLFPSYCPISFPSFSD